MPQETKESKENLKPGGEVASNEKKGKKEPATEKVEVELIDFNHLKEYAEGKVKEPIEEFSLTFEANAGGGRGPIIQNNFDLAGIILKIKQLLKLEKNGSQNGAQKGPAVSVKEATAGNGAAGAASQQKNFSNNKSKVIGIGIAVCVILLLGLGGWLLLPKFQNGTLGQWVQGLFGGSQPESILVEEETPLEEGLPDDPVVAEGPDVSGILERSNVQTLKFRKLDENNQAVADIIQSDVYDYIRNNATTLMPGEIYFLDIMNIEGERVDFNELRTILDFKMMPGWSSDFQASVKDYRLMVYKTADQGEAPQPISVGIVLIFDQSSAKMPQMADLRAWEATMVKDLSPLYFDGNELLLGSENSFKDSQLAENRRFVNFTADTSVSLEYAIVANSLVFATNKDSATAIFNLLSESSNGTGN